MNSTEAARVGQRQGARCVLGSRMPTSQSTSHTSAPASREKHQVFTRVDSLLLSQGTMNGEVASVGGGKLML
jgi:hypothetical protein